MATNNNFTVTGIVAMDAQVKNNGNGSVWAKFPLAIRTTKKDKDGNEKKISALQDIEVGTKEGSPKLDLLKKGTIVKVEGFFEPRTYTGKDDSPGRLPPSRRSRRRKIHRRLSEASFSPFRDAKSMQNFLKLSLHKGQM